MWSSSLRRCSPHDGHHHCHWRVESLGGREPTKSLSSVSCKQWIHMYWCACLLVALASRVSADNGTFATGDVHFTDLDSLLAVWEPRVLAESWTRITRAEEQGHLRSECRRDLQTFLEGLIRGEMWAVNMLDASGRYNRKLHLGSNFWLGSSDLCRELQETTFSCGFQVADLSINITAFDLPEKHTIHVGLCVPGTCSTEDTTVVLTALGPARQRELDVGAIRPIPSQYSPWKDLRFCALLGITAFMLVLVVLGTGYDLYLEWNSMAQVKPLEGDTSYNNNNNNNKGSCDQLDNTSGIKLDIVSFKKTCNGTGPLGQNAADSAVTTQHTFKQWQWREDVNVGVTEQIVLSFSLRTNLRKLCSLSVGDDTLAPIHGLRVISLMWVVLIHTCLILFQITDNKNIRMKAEGDFFFQTLSSGTYSVDTFFLISGMLVSFLYFRTVSKLTMEELTFTTGLKARFMQFLGMMGYRFARLTPPYMYVLAAVMLSMTYHRDHAVTEIYDKDEVTCEKFWWRNLLYINTFYPESERCMTWSWYLANDTQFYTVGIILLILAASHFRTAAAISVILMLSSWGTTAAVTLITHHRPSIQDPFANYADLYNKPWTRIGPYLIGMSTGWVLFKTNCTLKLHKGVVLTCWALALGCMASIVYGLYNMHFTPALSAIYVALSHSAWALSVAWVVVACCTGNGGYVDSILSWRYLYPVSRLTYCTYLVHTQVIRVAVLSYGSSIHLSNEIVMALFFGFLVMSYCAAFFVVVTFEAPFVSLLRIAHPMRRKKSS